MQQGKNQEACPSTQKELICSDPELMQVKNKRL